MWPFKKIPNNETKKYLLAKIGLATEMNDDLIGEFEKIYLPMEQNLLKAARAMGQQSWNVSLKPMRSFTYTRVYKNIDPWPEIDFHVWTGSSFTLTNL